MTEIHIVNGLHPGLPFSYYEELLRAFKRERPQLHLKGFTAVEIHYFAEHYGMTVTEVLERLVAAGLGSLPGGGAEIFADRVRRKICADKVDADGWLEVHRVAHRMGLRTNCTMLYGHIETVEERVDHLLRLRALQDETGGFQTFIPLAFHNENNALEQAAGADGRRRSAPVRRGAPDARQHPAHQGLLGDARRQGGADRAVVRRRRPRRHRRGREDLQDGRLARARGADAVRAGAPHPRRRPRAGRARHALQRGRAKVPRSTRCCSVKQRKSLEVLA